MRAVSSHVARILERANREFGATFDVERSRRDTLLYPYEVVRHAVANVLLKEARGYRFENPGAVLWDAITLPGYRLEEFAVANLEEVEKRCQGSWEPPSTVNPTMPPEPPCAALPTTMGSKADDSRDRRGSEKRRSEALRDLHASLPDEVRADVDRRAAEQARAGSDGRGAGSLLESVVALRALRAREEILEREHAGSLAQRLALASSADS